MNILAIADQESRSLWDYYEPSKLEGVDLILSCGDLSPKYLLFLGTFSPAPILYVHGNHDDCYAAEPPVNCICVEDRLYVHKDHQRKGIAAALCDALEAAAKPGRIYTHASLTARPFFLARGYKELRRQTVERLGVKMDNFVMEKRL